MPIVSVVIPAFNAARHLETAVESVFAQTFSNFEVIIVNDGSQDCTQAIAERLSDRDPRVRVVRTDNRGVEAARNTGIEHSDSEWIAFLDADDRWAPVKLAAQLAFLDSRPGLAATSSYGFYVGTQGRRFGVCEIGPTSLEELRRRLERCKPVWLLTPSVVCRRNVLIQHGGFDPSFHGAAEDLDLWTRIAERHDVLAIPQHLVSVRMSSNSASMTKHLQIQQNTLRVRVNARRRGLGEAPLDCEEFQNWFAMEGLERRRQLMRSWRSAYYYRQAGHHLLQGEYVNGLMDLARSSLASPRHVTEKVRRQILPFILRGIRN
jgi:glycosyltransferase involved in cell wall biosynthesis